MYQNNRGHDRRPQQSASTVSIKQVEIGRADNGFRRLFRSEVNGKPTGFVEKHFKGDTLVKEFALGGIANGVTETQAKTRFQGMSETINPSVETGLPDFLVRSEPVVRGKSAQARKPAPATKPVFRKSEPPPATTVRGSQTRRQGLALAGSVTTKKS